jgi:DNA anti-recombination protein RmuC
MKSVVKFSDIIKVDSSDVGVNLDGLIDIVIRAVDKEEHSVILTYIGDVTKTFKVRNGRGPDLHDGLLKALNDYNKELQEYKSSLLIGKGLEKLLTSRLNEIADQLEKQQKKNLDDIDDLKQQLSSRTDEFENYMKNQVKDLLKSKVDDLSSKIEEPVDNVRKKINAIIDVLNQNWES